MNTYTIVVTNGGPSNVSGAVINDSFPSTFTGVTYTATQTGGASGFSANGSGDIHDNVVMPAGSKITYKATGTISGMGIGIAGVSGPAPAGGGLRSSSASASRSAAISSTSSIPEARMWL